MYMKVQWLVKRLGTGLFPPGLASEAPFPCECCSDVRVGELWDAGEHI